MKHVPPIIILLGLLAPAAPANAADLVLPYASFGPQAIAQELIGMEWWQWDSHGESRPRDYPIHVVVYWNQTLAETKQRFPVDRSKTQDFRYVDYSAAVSHLEKGIKELRDAKLESSALEKALDRIHSARRKRL